MVCSFVDSSKFLQMLVKFYQIITLQIHILESSIIYHSLCMFYYIYPYMNELI